MEDYEISVRDATSGQFINLGSDDNFCSVRFDGVGSPELREAVYEVSGDDGIRFGIERYGVTTWNISGSIHSGFNKGVPGNPADAWNTWSTLLRAWTHYPERHIPRAVVPLYFKRPGRQEMIAYGRPQRMDPVTDRAYTGFITYTATFRQSDPRFYAAVDQVAILTLSESYAGGIIINNGTDMKLPFTTTTAIPVSGPVTNNGDIGSPPVIQIFGAVTNPIVSYLDGSGNVQWTISLLTEIAEGESVTIDTRQWARSITRDVDGTSLAGAYNGDKLGSIEILPGTGVLRYGATAGSGNTYVKVTHRNAWVST
jgi:hypothetical protein